MKKFATVAAYSKAKYLFVAVPRSHEARLRRLSDLAMVPMGRLIAQLIEAADLRAKEDSRP